MPNYFISAYATSCDWGTKSESIYFKKLWQNKDIIGIEHPFIPNNEKYSVDFLKKNIAQNWSIIITLVPETMLSLKENPDFGLASKNEAGRNSAVKLMEKTSDYIVELNKLFSRKIVKAVHFQSAPKNNYQEIRGNKFALKKSLLEINHFNWQGAELNLEHCENTGIVLNWARSVIEGRSTEHILKHIKMAQEANLLKGFFFSGCDASFKDNHLPPIDSLLTKINIQNCLDLLKKDIYLGIKVSNQSKLATVEQSLALNFNAIKHLKR
jgi:Domain of unknown function (DUF4862)